MKQNDIEYLIGSKAEKVTGISVKKGWSGFTLKNIQDMGKILERYGFKTEGHPCDDPRYVRWSHPGKSFFVTYSMGGISWSPEITENGTLIWTGTVYGLEIEPRSDDALSVLERIKKKAFSLATNNNGSGKLTVPFEHRMR